MRHAILFVAITLLSATLAMAAPKPAFEAQTIDDKVAIGYGTAIGDVNGDGKPDIVLADKKQYVWFQNPGKPGAGWTRHVMVENLTQHDNVCIAVRDINGDGKVEVAVGAQWNPGDTVNSGSVHYLIRPDDPTKMWTPVELHHEPVIHRMRWIKAPGGKFQLAVLPLHGRGNRGGQGAGVKLLAYDVPANPKDEWKTHVIIDTMHITHNFDPVQWDDDAEEEILLAGHEGVVLLDRKGDTWTTKHLFEGSTTLGAGEVRAGKLAGGKWLVTSVEPWHGQNLALYTPGGTWTRAVLDGSFNQAHALACADLLGVGHDQIVVGWRNPNADKKVGLKIFIPTEGGHWQQHLLDDNTMACEDLRIADLNGDAKPDIVAAGRATHNLKIYWNRTGK